ncbi:MAG: hypothetical protein Kow00129_14560 [Thermoleophilia bacterium]
MADQTDGPIRPWGRYEVLVDESDHKVKRIHVTPGMRLSLQRHGRRDELWVVVRGRGVAFVKGREVRLQPGDTVRVPRLAPHRIANTGEDELIFVEVQTGEYFGEDDIERLEDDFGRS